MLLLLDKLQRQSELSGLRPDTSSLVCFEIKIWWLIYYFCEAMELCRPKIAASKFSWTGNCTKVTLAQKRQFALFRKSHYWLKTTTRFFWNSDNSQQRYLVVFKLWLATWSADAHQPLGDWARFQTTVGRLAGIVAFSIYHHMSLSTSSLLRRIVASPNSFSFNRSSLPH